MRLKPRGGYQLRIRSDGIPEFEGPPDDDALVTFDTIKDWDPNTEWPEGTASEAGKFEMGYSRSWRHLWRRRWWSTWTAAEPVPAETGETWWIRVTMGVGGPGNLDVRGSNPRPGISFGRSDCRCHSLETP